MMEEGGFSATAKQKPIEDKGLACVRTFAGIAGNAQILLWL